MISLSSAGMTTSQPQLARRGYMETDVDHPPASFLSASVSQPDIHISGRSSEVRVMPPREPGDLPAAVIDHRPNQQHFYDRTGPLQVRQDALELCSHSVFVEFGLKPIVLDWIRTPHLLTGPSPERGGIRTEIF